MEINTLNPNDLYEKYNLLVKKINNGLNLSGPVFFTWLVARPMSSSIRHQHHEAECLIVVKGKGSIHCGNKVNPIAPGTFITLKPFEDHSIKNESAEEELLILSIVIEDLAEANKTIPIINQKFAYKKYLIISTPPTPNGDLHLGHIAGPYLRADVIRRFLIINGLTAFHLTGQDDHQSYTAHKGKTLSWSPEYTADYYGDQIKSTLDQADIDLSYFAKPKISSSYFDYIQEEITSLWKSGKIFIKEDSPSLFCKNCDQYLYEVYVFGFCPHCLLKTSGNFCEACGKINDCADLLDPKCSICNSIPIYKNIPRAYFKLTPYTKKLIDYHKNTNMSEKLRKFCSDLLQTPLPDVPVSHLSNWGIPCPIPELKGHIISVWFEMGLGHLASTNAFIEEKRPPSINSGLEFWTASDSTVLYSFGFDNSFFNCFLFPATYYAMEKDLKTASSLYLNQFYCLEGLKFSTSRNHLIWAKDFLKSHSSDAMRLFLSHTSPENNKSSFSHREFNSFIDKFKTDLGACCAILNTAIKETFSGKAPVTGLWENNHIKFYKKLCEYTGEISAHYCPESFSLQLATNCICNILKNTLDFVTNEIQNKAEYRHTDEYRTSVAIGLLALKALSFTMYPITPRTSHILWQNLGYPRTIIWEALPTWIPSNHSILNLSNTNEYLY